MIKPYYDQDGITIYCADMRDVLPMFAPKSFDLLLTDPPYGIGRDGEKASTGSHGGRKAYDFLGWDQERPDAEAFRLMFEASRNQIVWGGNYFTEHLPPSMGWLVWDKAQRIDGSDAELAFTSFDRALRVYTLNRVAIAQDGAVHPTQKPERLMRWCIANATEPGDLILDPYAGSGTTGRAAKDLGRRAVLIEREERFCEIAVRRLQQAVLPGMEAA